MRVALRLLMVLCFGCPLHALELPAVFSDGMVLQRGVPVPVWGKAAPGQAVTVAFGEAQAQALADGEGRWRVDLPALAASARPATLVVEAKALPEPPQDNPPADVHLEFKDVLVGDVWHCSGQSNMELSLIHI